MHGTAVRTCPCTVEQVLVMVCEESSKDCCAVASLGTHCMRAHVRIHVLVDWDAYAHTRARAHACMPARAARTHARTHARVRERVRLCVRQDHALRQDHEPPPADGKAPRHSGPCGSDDQNVVALLKTKMLAGPTGRLRRRPTSRGGAMAYTVMALYSYGREWPGTRYSAQLELECDLKAIQPELEQLLINTARL